MYLVTNSVSAQQVEETDDAYIIRDVPFVKPMHLSGGYVPEYSIKQTANGWEGKPATLNHTRNQKGEPIAAARQPEKHIGEIQDPEFDGEYVRANIRIEKNELQSANTAKIKQDLENGNTINVSSQYAAQDLEPGEYDGEYRDNVEEIIRPDSVAILPTKQGKCSIQDGCGINPQMVANAEVSLTANSMQDNQDIPEEYQFDNPGEAMQKARDMGFEDIHTHGEGEDTIFMPGATHDELVSELEDMEGMEANQGMELIDLSPSSVDEFTDSEWDGDDVTSSLPNPSENDDAPGTLDATHVVHPSSEEARDSKTNWLFPFRAGPNEPVNTRALVAIKGSRGVEGTDAISGEMKSEVESWVNSLLEEAPDDLFGAIETEGGSKHMEDNVLRRVGRNVIDALNLGTAQTANDGGGNSPVETEGSDMDRDKLIDEITSNSALTEAALEERCNDGLEAIHSDIMANESDDNPEEVVMTENDLESLIEDKAQEIVANREEETKKEEKAKEIVANSAEYEEVDTVLEDYPTEAALEAKKNSLEDTATMPGTGATANTDFDSDPEFDVGSGVLTE